MYKKNKYLLVVLLLLAVSTAYFLFRDSSSTIKKELRDFAVKDTAAISRIFLADRNERTVTLDRSASGWVLNNKYPVRMDLMNALMNCIYSVDVKNGIPKTGYNTVIKNLASGGIKCEIYLNGSDKPEKVYYVGDHTQDGLGTYMLLENSSVPFITEIPGFNGYLSPRYSTNEKDWKDPIIFHYPMASIQAVTVHYPAFPDHSFKLERDGRRFELKDPVSGQELGKADSVRIENYLDLYNGIYYESVDADLSEQQRDSLLHAVPISEIKVRDTSGAEKGIRLFQMAINASSLSLQDSLGQPLKYDLDRMNGFLEPEKEWVVVQHYTFDRLLRSPQSFLKK